MYLLIKKNNNAICLKKEEIILNNYFVCLLIIYPLYNNVQDIINFCLIFKQVFIILSFLKIFF